MTLAMPVFTPVLSHMFRVERTIYGWLVSQDGLRRGLFVTLSSAMEDVRGRGLVLRRLRETWAVTVVGRETTATGDEPVDARPRSRPSPQTR